MNAPALLGCACTLVLFQYHEEHYYLKSRIREPWVFLFLC